MNKTVMSQGSLQLINILKVKKDRNVDFKTFFSVSKQYLEAAPTFLVMN